MSPKKTSLASPDATAISQIKKLRKAEAKALNFAKDKQVEANVSALKIGELIAQQSATYGGEVVKRIAKACGFSEQSAYAYCQLFNGAQTEDRIRQHPDLSRDYWRALGSSVRPQDDIIGIVVREHLIDCPVWQITGNPDDLRPDAKRVRDVGRLVKDFRRHLHDNGMYHIVAPSNATLVVIEDEGDKLNHDTENGLVFHSLADAPRFIVNCSAEPGKLKFVERSYSHLRNDINDVIRPDNPVKVVVALDNRRYKRKQDLILAELISAKIKQPPQPPSKKIRTTKRYDKNNASTEGKETCHNVVNFTIMGIANHLVTKNQNQNAQGKNQIALKGLSFPSEFANQETKLQDELQGFGDQVKSTIDGVEKDANVYAKALKAIPEGMTMLPCMEYADVLKLGNTYDWIWLDVFGNAMTGAIKPDSFINQFIQSALLLNHYGVMFFTCRAFPRASRGGLTAEEQYKILTGEELTTVPYHKMIHSYKQIIQKALGKGYNIFSTVIYKACSGDVYVMFGVAKNWTPKKVNLNLIEGDSYEKFVADEDWQKTTTIMNTIERSIQELPTKFLTSKNLKAEILGITPNMTPRTLEYFENRVREMQKSLRKCLRLTGITPEIKVSEIKVQQLSEQGKHNVYN